MRMLSLSIAVLCLATMLPTANAAITLSLGANGETTQSLGRSTGEQLTFYISGTPADQFSIAVIDFGFPGTVTLTGVVSGIDDPTYFAAGNLFDTTIMQDAPQMALNVSQTLVAEQAPSIIGEKWFTLTLDTSGVGPAGGTFNLTLDQDAGGFLNGNFDQVAVNDIPLSFSVDAAAVPEPSCIAFVALAAVGLACRRQRRACLSA